MKRIILVGMPRSGKTTLGRALAEKLKIPFYDSDTVLTQKFSAPVTDIFTKLGETTFRLEEAACIAELLSRDESFVLATGGGSVQSEKVRLLLQREAFVLWVHAPIEVLAERMWAEIKSGKQLPKFLYAKEDSVLPQEKNKHLEKIIQSLLPIYIFREEFYRSLALYKIENSAAIEDACTEIFSLFERL